MGIVERQLVGDDQNGTRELPVIYQCGWLPATALALLNTLLWALLERTGALIPSTQWFLRCPVLLRALSWTVTIGGSLQLPAPEETTLLCEILTEYVSMYVFIGCPSQD